MRRNISLIKVFCLTIPVLFLTQTYYAFFFKHWLILYSAFEDMLRKATNIVDAITASKIQYQKKIEKFVTVSTVKVKALEFWTKMYRNKKHLAKM